MRLWHETLIPLLPRQQLLGQHREVATLRGKGWGKKHATVDYVFTHSYYKLFQFHLLVLAEMEKRSYTPDPVAPVPLTHPIYPEHNDSYLAECLLNLEQKGILLPRT